MTSREGFERWVRSLPGDYGTNKLYEIGGQPGDTRYLDPNTSRMWMAWEARQHFDFWRGNDDSGV